MEATHGRNIMNWEHSIVLFCSCFFRSLGENPLHCDCKLQWLRERLLGANNQFPYIRHIENLKCATPSRLQGRTLVNLSEEVLCGKTSACIIPTPVKNS